MNFIPFQMPAMPSLGSTLASCPAMMLVSRHPAGVYNASHPPGCYEVLLLAGDGYRSERPTGKPGP